MSIPVAEPSAVRDFRTTSIARTSECKPTDTADSVFFVPMQLVSTLSLPRKMLDSDRHPGVEEMHYFMAIIAASRTAADSKPGPNFASSAPRARGV